MSIRSLAARHFCAVLAGGMVGIGSAPAMAAQPAAPQGGLLLDRLSKGDARLWRTIEGVVTASNSCGAPRSPTLRRLWEWARTTPHVIRIEMVRPSRLAAGVVGVFRAESFDPKGQRHVAVIRLCPDNIRRAKVAASPNAALPFVRFAGLSEVDRFAEVLAHELAHAEYALETPGRLVEFEAAQAAIEQTFSRAGRGARPWDELVRESVEPFAVLTAAEAHAESVEAAVLRELTDSSTVATTARPR